MSKIKEMMSDWKYLKVCLYIVFTAALLYIIYLIIGNLDRVLITIASVLSSIASAFTPLIIGLIIAYLLSPLVEFVNNKAVSRLFFKVPSDPIKLEKLHGRQRTISILITFLFIFFIICIIIYAFAFLIVGNLVFTSVQNMVDDIVDYFMKYESELKSWTAAIPNSGIEVRLQSYANDVISWIYNNFSTAGIINYISNIGGGLLNMVLGIVVSIYLIKDKDFFIRLWRKTLHLSLPMKANAAVAETLSEINAVVSQFLRGQLLDALIIAILSSIGLSLVGLDFAVFIGCFAGICNIIPYFGPVISIVPAALVGLLTGGPSEALFAILVLLTIQQIDGNIIYPRVVGSSTGLHPLFVLISVTV
ncbi:MAG TPA: AI-2E family transporter, partial [Anaerovoracaceae bacterium]|nr:AI-2E family transporter [Anaerovoracaceae bacterium]